MPYAYGVANDQHDLLGKVRAFLLENGWTEHLYTDDLTSKVTYPNSAGTQGKRLHMSKGGIFINFRSLQRAVPFEFYNGSPTAVIDGKTTYAAQMNGIAFCYSTGFDSAQPWDKQPGYYAVTSKSVGGAIWCGGALPSYRLFLLENPFTLFIALEYEVGKWRCGVLGNTIKAFPFSGGEVCGGSCVLDYPSYDNIAYGNIPLLSDRQYTGISRLVRAVGLGDTYAQDILVGMYSGTTYRMCPAPLYGSKTYGHIYELLMLSMPSSYTGILPLIPISIVRYKTAESQILGDLAHIRRTAAPGYNPCDIITMGAERWMLLPYLDGSMSSAFAVPYDGV